MAEAQPAVAAPPETVFLDLADWKRLAREDRSRVAGLGVSWTPGGQEVRMPSDLSGPESDYVRDFVITTSEQDRYGDVVDVEGWDWTDYFRGGPGVVLFAHDRRGLAMAKCPWIKTVAQAQVGRCVFPTQAECGYAEDEPSFWKTIRLMYTNGFMKNTSVGFMAVEWTFDEETNGLHFIKQMGLEWSLCSVPANPGCYSLAKAAGIDVSPLRQWAIRTLDEVNGVEGVYLTKKRLERAVRELGSEKGIAYFDLGELTLAQATAPVQERTAAALPAEKKGAGRVVKALEAAGLTLDDLVAAAKAAKATAAQPVMVTTEEFSVVEGEVVSEGYLEVEDAAPADELLLVDEEGKAVELTPELFTLMLRGALTDAINEEQTRVTGKVF